MIGFWFLEVSSLLFVYMLFSFFFSGHMFPLDMLPGVVGQMVKLTPFQYLAYFPAAVFLGKIQGAALVCGLACNSFGCSFHRRQPTGLLFTAREDIAAMEDKE